MRRILLVAANTERLPDPVYPLGAATVVTALRAAGHAVATLDLCFEADRPGALEKALREHRPDVLALSLRNLDSSSFPDTRSFVDDYRELVRLAKAWGPTVPVVLGGAGLTAMPERVLQHTGADYAVAGEGERAVVWLMARLDSGLVPRSGEGFLVQAVGSASLVRASEWGRAMDGLAAVDRSCFDAARYHREGGCLNVQSKRGCAFQCSFCSYPIIEGDRLRLRDPEAVVDELQAESRRWGVRHWFITDSVFNVPLAHAKAICQGIVRRGLKLEWSAYFNPRQFDDELAGLLAAAGCRDVEFGSDSGSDRMLEALNKGFSTAEMRAATALCRKHRLRVCQSLMFGGPGEDRSTVLETLALMDELDPQAVIAMTGIRIMAGTALERQARSEGALGLDEDLLHPRFYFSASLGQEVVGLIERHALSRPNWIVPGLGVRQNVEALRAMRQRDVKGQLWRMVSLQQEPH
jgi:radical SAM superfamily enzyme YgiQ (UPF0313 family)